MATVSIFTPTYNRGELLINCYNSLLKQTCDDFEWVIVDDGSTDNTQSVVQGFIDERKVPVRYFYKDNGGKHTAINYAVNRVTSPLFAILDSDDTLYEDAVEKFVYYTHKYENKQNLCGFYFLRTYKNGEIWGDKFPVDEAIGNFFDNFRNGGISGEKSEVYFTRCLKEFPFPVYEDEVFLPESTVWIPMGEKYDAILINYCFCISEYLPDGLTKQGRLLRINSSLGSMANAKAHLIKKCNIRLKVKKAIQYNYYKFFALQQGKKIPEELIVHNYKLLILVTKIPGYFLYKKRIKQYR